NVINLSIGEPEITLSRDIVVQAIDGAARAGVVPVVAAGNDFDVLGYGSIDSPGSAPAAITVAAATKGGAIAGFSSAGPTPYSLRFKPDVAAPGVSILSSVPVHLGSWRFLDGTSMASPHVAGAAGLPVRATATRRAAAADSSGFVVLTRGGETRRIPYWLHVSARALAREPHAVLRRPGTYRGNTRRGKSIVSSYRFPSGPSSLGLRAHLFGPELVFRLILRGRVTNAGARVLSEAAGV